MIGATTAVAGVSGGSAGLTYLIMLWAKHRNIELSPEDVAALSALATAAAYGVKRFAFWVQDVVNAWLERRAVKPEGGGSDAKG